MVYLISLLTTSADPDEMQKVILNTLLLNTAF